MQISQLKYTTLTGWQVLSNGIENNKAQVVFVFGSTELVKNNIGISEIKSMFPAAIITGCSTSGEIAETHVYDNTLIATALFFEKTNIKFWCEPIEKADESSKIGKKIFDDLYANDLRHILVFSEGLVINGSELVEGLKNVFPQNVSITGGLAGDGADFKETYVYDNGIAKNKIISAIGLYGDNIEIGYGSLGGWDSFGVERLVTKSHKNILFEMDGEPALKIYKSFLGEHADKLPASGLLFPLSVRTNDTSIPVVRTILGIDEKNQSLTFAGNIDEGSYVRLMKANFDRLIDGAVNAAKVTVSNSNLANPDLALCISCVGRKLVLKQMIEEEVEGVKEVLGKKTKIFGFYSYGEISPFNASATCELHNQTMTITTFKELI
ncbi:MAG: FIST signal transduction protein [Bacteroidia bacterium]